MSSLSGNRSDNAWEVPESEVTFSAPFQLVKDRGRDYETGNVDAVLDGDLNGFMEAELRRQRAH